MLHVKTLFETNKRTTYLDANVQLPRLPAPLEVLQETSEIWYRCLGS